jgi:subtilisin-like proprotein convertase family protein
MVPLGLLNGQSALGLWKLWVEDPPGKSYGTIDNWSLTVS